MPRCAATHLAPVVKDLLDAGCEVRGDAAVQKVDARVKPATEQDWYTEYLDAIIAARVVDGVDAAIAHIAQVRLGAHREHRHRERRDRAAFPRRGWTAPSCCTTPRRSSPMAASSAWARRSASPPTAFMRAGRWAWSSSRSYKYVVRGTGQIRP